MRADALTGHVFVDDQLIGHRRHVPIGGDALRDLLRPLRQGTEFLRRIHRPVLVVVPVTVVLHPPPEIIEPRFAVDRSKQRSLFLIGQEVCDVDKAIDCHQR